MIIKNGKVFQEDGSYKVTDLYIENGRIAEIHPRFPHKVPDF